MSDNFDRQVKSFVDGIADDVQEALVVLLKEQKVPEKNQQSLIFSMRQVIEGSFMKRYKGVRKAHEAQK